MLCVPSRLTISDKMSSRFENLPLETRKKEYKRVTTSKKGKGRVPVICQPQKNSKFDKENVKTLKFCCNRDLQYGRLQYLIRNRLPETVKPSEAIYLMVNNKIPIMCEKVFETHDREKSPDGFLYVTYCAENTFG